MIKYEDVKLVFIALWFYRPEALIYPSIFLISFQDGILPPHYAIRPVGGLSFAGAERVRSKLLALKRPKDIPVIRITTIDSLTVFPDNDTIPNGTALTTDIETTTVRSAEVLIVYCDSLYRLDYTFSQVRKR